VRSNSHDSFTSVFGQQKSLVSSYPYKHLQGEESIARTRLKRWLFVVSCPRRTLHKRACEDYQPVGGVWVFRTKSNFTSETVHMLSGSDC